MTYTAIAPIHLTIEDEDGGERLDRVLARRCPTHSRTALQRWIEEGRVEQAGEVVTRKTKAIAGADIVVYPSPPEAPHAEPQALPLEVVFEDDCLLIINKQAGLVVHPGPGHPDGTLVNALVHHAKVRGGSDPLRPGIVHRLDKDTSGVMVVAKTPLVHERLVEMFQAHQLERAYLAIALGRTPSKHTFETLHGRHPVHRKRFTTRLTRGRRAVTHLQTLAVAPAASLVRCRLETGRTHQIRVHLSEAGHPLLGDPLYGASIRDAAVRRISAELGRQALHASVLGLRHPMTGEALYFETEPPEDFDRAWLQLGDGRG